MLIANTRKVLLVFSTAVNCCKYRIRHGQQQALKQEELTGNSGLVKSLNTGIPPVMLRIEFILILRPY